MSTRRLKLTDAAIERYVLDESVTRLRDERYSLELRFRKDRTKPIKGTWWLIDKRKNNGHDRKAKWEKLGTWPQLPAKELLKVLPQKIAAMAIGHEHEVTHFQTFGDVLNWYLDHVELSRQITKTRRSTVKSVIVNHLMPPLGELPLVGVRKHQIKNALIWPLQSKYQPRTVKGYFAVLKAAFMQAAREELIASNPMSVIQLSDFMKASVKPNEARLLPPMLADLFTQLNTKPWPSRMLVLLQIAHGTRIRETYMSRWSWFDFEAKVLRIPGRVTKTSEPHVLPLTDQVMALLERYRQTQPKDALVLFPSSDRTRSFGKDKANEIYKDVSQGEWTSHHCRKLARTCLADLGVDLFVGERILNHKLKGLEQAYVHTTTENLKRQALEAYHAWLDDKGFFIFHGKTVGRSETQNQIIQAAGWL